MVGERHPRWEWEPVDPNRGGGSGDFAKLLQNQRDKKPGFLAEAAPSPNAYFLAREVIQNAWDAALECRLSLAGTGTREPDFEVSFCFRTLCGTQRADFVHEAGLREHAERLTQITERSVLGLRAELSLDGLDVNEGLPVLLIEETGTTGMYGPWRGAESKLYQALGSLGITPKKTGGGSFGYGKSGLIKGSAPRVVIAYTCFAERPDDTGVTRRLLGVTYWGSHKLGVTDFTGMARLHNRGDSAVPARPFENDDADRIAAVLGFRVRSPADPQDLGSSFCLVEPTVTPDELKAAINRYWWPAIEDPRLRFRASIQDGDQVIHPRPKQSTQLRSFVTAYEEATTPPKKQVGKDPFRRRHEVWSRTGARLGVLSLIASKQWSFPDLQAEESEVPDASLVALLRRPRMVIEYLPLKQQAEDPPIVRGVFVADDNVDDHLRQTEPFGHDAWKHDGEDAPAQAREYAEEINRKVLGEVRKFRRALRPPPPPREKVRLTEWDRIMRAILRGDAPSAEGSRTSPGGVPAPPIQRKRDLSIQPDIWRASLADGHLRAYGEVVFGFTDNFGGSEAMVEVTLSLVRVEADKAGKLEEVPLRPITPPKDFVAVGAQRWSGRLTREGVAIAFESQPYSADWTLRLIADGRVV